MTENEFDSLSTDEKLRYLFSCCQEAQKAVNANADRVRLLAERLGRIDKRGQDPQ